MSKLIPHTELSAWNQETEAARAWTTRWINVLEPLEHVKGRTKQFAIVAQTMGYDHGKKVTASKVKRLYYAWINEGWRGVIDRTYYPEPNSTSLPPAFVEYWKGLLENHQRNGVARQSLRVALGRLDRWHATNSDEYAIPGYSYPPALDSHCENLRRSVPTGWSYRNLVKIKPSKINLVSRRHGAKAAAMYLPSNYTTRKGLKFLERVFFDDQEYDNQIVLPGSNPKPMRPMGFNALDHCTGSFTDYQIKLTEWDVEEAKKRQLNQKDFVWMNLAYYMRVGYRADDVGTTQILEHGTTTGYAHKDQYDDRNYDEILYQVSGGKIVTERSGRFNDPIFSGMYFRPSSTGNFKFKSPLEGIFNLVRNYASALPYQTGRNRDEAPAENYGLDLYCKKLLKVYETLSPESRELLRFPALEYPEFVGIMRDVYQAINERRDHKLEGWSFHKKEISIGGGGWQSLSNFDALPDKTRADVLSIAQYRAIPMSPNEAARQEFQNDASLIETIDESFIPTIIPFDWARSVTVNKKHEIRIQDQSSGLDELIYIASLTTANGRRENLNSGEKFRAFLNPYFPDRLILATDDGRFVGGVDRFIRAKASNTAAILRNQGTINRFASEVAAPMERRAATIAEARTNLRDHNDRVIAEDKSRHNAAAEMVLSPEDFEGGPDSEFQDYEDEPPIENFYGQHGIDS